MTGNLDPCNVVEEGRKRGNPWAEADLQEEAESKDKILRREKSVGSSLVRMRTTK
jgi:hypothetical protein